MARSTRKPSPPKPPPPERVRNFQYDEATLRLWSEPPPPHDHDRERSNVVNAILLLIDLSETQWDRNGWINSHLRDIRHIDWFYHACPDTWRELGNAIRANTDAVRANPSKAFLRRP